MKRFVIWLPPKSDFDQRAPRSRQCRAEARHNPGCRAARRSRRHILGQSGVIARTRRRETQSPNKTDRSFRRRIWDARIAGRIRDRGAQADGRRRPMECRRQSSGQQCQNIRKQRPTTKPGSGVERQQPARSINNDQPSHRRADPKRRLRLHFTSRKGEIDQACRHIGKAIANAGLWDAMADPHANDPPAIAEKRRSDSSFDLPL